jgi:hypothetical protein
VERDREMVAVGLMSQREFDKRMPTRDVARRIRQRDNTSIWPRDPKTEIGRSIPMTEGRTVVGADLSEGKTKH